MRAYDAQGLEVQPAKAVANSDSNVTTVGLDGGYLRLCDADQEKSFEVVAGRAMRNDVGQRNNADSLPNYGRRYRSGQRVSSAFVESAVNQLIDKRMSKSQQMRWDPRSAHLLLQVRVCVIDGQLRDDFAR